MRVTTKWHLLRTYASWRDDHFEASDMMTGAVAYGCWYGDESSLYTLEKALVPILIFICCEKFVPLELFTVSLSTVEQVQSRSSVLLPKLAPFLSSLLRGITEQLQFTSPFTCAAGFSFSLFWYSSMATCFEYSETSRRSPSGIMSVVLAILSVCVLSIPLQSSALVTWLLLPPTLTADTTHAHCWLQTSLMSLFAMRYNLLSLPRWVLMDTPNSKTENTMKRKS